MLTAELRQSSKQSLGNSVSLTEDALAIARRLAVTGLLNVKNIALFEWHVGGSFSMRSCVLINFSQPSIPLNTT